MEMAKHTNRSTNEGSQAENLTDYDSMGDFSRFGKPKPKPQKEKKTKKFFRKTKGKK